MSLTHDEREAGRIFRKAKARERKERKAERPANVKASRGRERDNGYLAYLRRQPCRIAGQTPCEGPVQAAHLRYGDAAHGRINPGLQVKPSDQWATSLCAAHHAEQHAAGNERAWWNGYGLDGSAVALSQYAKYQEPTND